MAVNRYQIGVDVGGTFTDLVCGDNEGNIHFEKTVTNRKDQAQGVLRGLSKLANRAGHDLAKFLDSADFVVHGTTIATNAMLQMSGAKTGLLITEGFRDELEMRRGYREDIYDIGLQEPPVIIPRKLSLGVAERISYDGKIVQSLDEKQAISQIQKLLDLGVESIAVSFLFSFLRPEHEERVRELINELSNGEVFISLSSEILPQIREYERTSTTAINAFVSPLLSDYLSRLRQLLGDEGYRKQVFVMQSNGGVLGLDEASRFGVGSLLSGPAGGVRAASFLGNLLGFPNLITLDMGGTSCEVSLIESNVPTLTTNSWLNRQRVALPMLNIHTIGAGGGSIAWVTSGGLLRVGPESAGADPGPACYGFGGTKPTVTDASLVLGFLDSSSVLGGEIELDYDAAVNAIEQEVGKRLDLNVYEAAHAIHRIVNNNMMNAVRLVSTERGYDVRDFSLLAMGGAGGMHAGKLASDLEVSTVIVPKSATVLSALGNLLADLKVTELRTFFSPSDDVDISELNRIFDDLLARAEARIGHKELRQSTDIIRFVDMRYHGEVHEVTVPFRSRTRRITDLNLRAAIHDFHALHQKLYAYSEPGNQVEMVNLRLDLVGRMRKPRIYESDFGDEDPSIALKGEREVMFEGPSASHTAKIFDGAMLRPGHVIEGPAIIDEWGTIIVVYDEQEAMVDRFGNYVIEDHSHV